MTERAMVVCAGCGTERERPIAARTGAFRTPAGWKRLQGQLWCPVCKRRAFVLRAIAVPVSGPADATWPELRAALHTAFADTTRCANWLITQLYARDRQRQPADGRLPKMPAIYLYPEARVLFPALASQTLASLERQAQARYRAARLDLIWRHAVSLPTYRYPTPLPLPSRMWNLARHQQRWQVSMRIGDRRWALRLRQGPGMWRQIRVLEGVADGRVEAGEATLYETTAHRGDHRGTGTRDDRRLMIKLAVWHARCEPVREREDETLVVRTAADAFLTAHIAGHDRDPLWTLNADHIRRWIAEATRRRQRLHDAVAHDAAVRAERELADRLHRRCDAWTHQATAQVIAWAQQRRVGAIAWDAADRGYLPSYPWHRFITTLTDKAAAAGIRIDVLSR